MDRKKELKEQYKLLRQDMGLICVRCMRTGKVYIEASNRTKATINRLIFTLKFGNHKCEELQKDWNLYGEEVFKIEVLESLEYDEDEPDRNYSDELELLRMVWADKLNSENTEMYN